MTKEIILIGAYPPPYGGIATFTENLYRLLHEAGYKVLVIAFGKSINKDNQIKNLKPSFFSLLTKYHYFSSNTICLDSGDFCLEEPFWQMAPLWYFFKRTKRFRWIKFIHSGSLPDRYEKFCPLRKIIFKVLLSQIDEMVVVNEELRGWFTSRVSFKKPIYVISSYLAENNTDNLEQQIPQSIVEFLQSHERSVISIGLFIEAYGFDQIARVVEEMRFKSGVDICLLLIDGGVSTNCKYKEDILTNRPWIMPLKEIDRSVVAQITSKCDVFVRGCKYESFGLSRIEAINHGTPVIATNIGETRGMFLYHFGDEKQLYEHLKYVLSHRETIDLEKWKKFYKTLANQNFNNIKKIIEE